MATARAPDEQRMVRFVGKVAMEALAHRALESGVDLIEELSSPQLDPLREFVRYGRANKIWPCHKRELYPEDHVFQFDRGGDYEVLHEWTFLYSDKLELYFVLAIFGIEYVINMGGPEIDGYLAWLEKFHYRSPLYPDGENAD